MKFEFFLLVSFQVGRAGQQNNGPASTKFLRAILGRNTDLNTKFQPNRTIFAEVIPFNRILAGRLVEPIRIQFLKIFLLKSRWT